mmetsp:Transcript_84357/g.251413  ORF Transcript_84357/g.251413 Transcript_84357/m.251413 type:complete len:246 (+) Transcript_84357:159-896(+)
MALLPPGPCVGMLPCRLPSPASLGHSGPAVLRATGSRFRARALTVRVLPMAKLPRYLHLTWAALHTPLVAQLVRQLRVRAGVPKESSRTAQGKLRRGRSQRLGKGLPQMSRRCSCKHARRRRPMLQSSPASRPPTNWARSSGRSLPAAPPQGMLPSRPRPAWLGGALRQLESGRACRPRNPSWVCPELSCHCPKQCRRCPLCLQEVSGRSPSQPPRAWRLEASPRPTCASRSSWRRTRDFRVQRS